MNGSVRSVLLITIPAMVGLIVLAQPIVELAFMRGAFTQADADATAVCLRYYTLALVSISVNNVQNRVFYSLEDTKTPFTWASSMCSLTSVVTSSSCAPWALTAWPFPFPSPKRWLHGSPLLCFGEKSAISA